MAKELPKHIVLTEANSTQLVGEVTDASIQAVIDDISRADPSKPYYLYLRSPGGEILAGNRLVEFLKGTEIQVEVIVQEAASMAAVITESVKVRHITSTGFVMFHHAQLGVQGDIDQVAARVGFAQQLQEVLDEGIAERMGLSIEEFKKKEGFEWFLNSHRALKENAIDDVVVVSCDPSMKGKQRDAVGVGLFGVPTHELRPVCPL